MNKKILLALAVIGVVIIASIVIIGVLSSETVTLDGLTFNVPERYFVNSTDDDTIVLASPADDGSVWTVEIRVTNNDSKLEDLKKRVNTTITANGQTNFFNVTMLSGNKVFTDFRALNFDGIPSDSGDITFVFERDGKIVEIESFYYEPDRDYYEWVVSEIIA